MDPGYRKNKTAFRRCVSKYVADSKLKDGMVKGKLKRLQPDFEDKLLEGFREFMPRGNLKRQAVDDAKSIAVALNYTGNDHVFVLIDENKTETTVSTNIRPDNIRRILAECCRGAIHHQILQFREENGKEGDEVDHCNEGGFKSLLERFIDDKGEEHLKSHVVCNDPRSAKCIGGFKTFREPVLSEWIQFHEENVQLQCLSRAEHREKTNKRLRVTTDGH